MFKNNSNGQIGVSQEKMAQVPTGAAGKDLDVRGEKPARINSKRRRTEKSITAPDSSSSGLKDSSANLTSAVAISKSPRHTPANSSRQADNEEPYEQIAKSNSSIGQDHFNATTPPTLHAKRRENDSRLPRRKSSKRKAEDQARERDIRAMSSPIPIPKRPLSYSEGPLRRDTIKAPSRLNKHGDQSASEVSLPLPESLSNMGIGLKQNSFKVSALEVLSPRPTIRYSRSPYSPPRMIENPSRTFAQPMVGEKERLSQTRIDDLADNLDAKALRELMERDQRRRERKRKTDQARLEQKIRRRAEYEKQHEARKGGGSRNEKDQDTPRAALSPPAHLVASDDSKGIPADPFSDDNVIGSELLVRPTLRPESSIYTRASQASFSPPSSPTQRAFDHASLSPTSGLPRAATPDMVETAELGRRASQQSSVQLGSWTSFFKRGGMRGKRSSLDRGRHASGEFSNTSRDSVSKAQPQASLVGAPRTFRSSGTPQRTQSKFREDLPELPLSPPDSRVQSPEVGARSVITPASPSQDQAITNPSTGGLAKSSSRATFDQSWKDDQLGESQADEPPLPPTAALSRSLASVDSEGSWLSGKPAKRSSIQRDQPSRQSQSSSQPPFLESDLREEGDVADDPYFSRLSPAIQDRRKSSPLSTHRKASSTALNMDLESDFEGESQAPALPEKSEERWHAGLGRQPILVMHAAQARSKEGLLREYQATDPESGVVEEETSELESPEIEDSDLQASNSPIFRAHSINYGQGHARRISAGSAKLLDIRRSSVDSSKRQSLPRGERSSTPISGPAPQEEE